MSDHFAVPDLAQSIGQGKIHSVAFPHMFGSDIWKKKSMEDIYPNTFLH